MSTSLAAGFEDKGVAPHSWCAKLVDVEHRHSLLVTCRGVSMCGWRMLIEVFWTD